MAVEAVSAVERTRTAAERALVARLEATRLEEAKLEQKRVEEERLERARAQRAENERLATERAESRQREQRDADDVRIEHVSFAHQLAELSRLEGLRIYRVQAEQRVGAVEERYAAVTQLARFGAIDRIDLSTRALGIAGA